VAGKSSENLGCRLDQGSRNLLECGLSIARVISEIDNTVGECER
jgi:hypothetical protein